MIIGATFFIGSLLRWGFQLMEKILKPEEDVELIKEVDKEVETKERALLVWDLHMKVLIDFDLPCPMKSCMVLAPRPPTQLKQAIL